MVLSNSESQLRTVLFSLLHKTECKDLPLQIGQYSGASNCGHFLGPGFVAVVLKVTTMGRFSGYFFIKKG